jgi:N6-adenosine-specific RNA methylase IME4
MSGCAPIPAGPWDVIVADPPWRFASNSDARPGRNARRHYPTMTTDEIAAMPVAGLASPRALLLLWATSPMLPQALEVMAAWRFRYVSQVVWVKHRIGTGYWVRNRHELLLIGRRPGTPCPRPLFTDSVYVAPTREHSRKPDGLFPLIDAAMPADFRRIELFARVERPGWTAWGNDTDHFARAVA